MTISNMTEYRQQQKQIIESAKASGQVFVLKGISSPTCNSKTTYYIDGDQAVIHVFVFDRMHPTGNINHYRIASRNEARQDYAQQREWAS